MKLDKILEVMPTDPEIRSAAEEFTEDILEEIPDPIEACNESYIAGVRWIITILRTLKALELTPNSGYDNTGN